MFFKISQPRKALTIPCFHGLLLLIGQNRVRLRKKMLSIIYLKRLPIVAGGNRTLALLLLLAGIILHREHHLDRSKPPAGKKLETAKSELARVPGLQSFKLALLLLLKIHFSPSNPSAPRRSL